MKAFRVLFYVGSAAGCVIVVFEALPLLWKSSYPFSAIVVGLWGASAFIETIMKVMPTAGDGQ